MIKYPRLWIIRQRRPNELILETLSLFREICIEDFSDNRGVLWSDLDDMFECIEVELRPVKNIKG